MKLGLKDFVWCCLFVLIGVFFIGFTLDKFVLDSKVSDILEDVLYTAHDDSKVSNKGDEILELLALRDAYVGYRAYDDGEFSDAELDVLINPFNRDLEEELSRDQISRRAELAYERRVNELIEHSDGSDGHLKFKRYVLGVERDDLLTIGFDGVVDDRDRELLSLAGDVTGFDVGIVESGILDSLGENGNRDMVSSYEEMLVELYGDDEDFDVRDAKYSWDRKDLTFKVD